MHKMLYCKLKKMIFSKLKSPFTRIPGKNGKEPTKGSLIDKAYVNEEYMEAFRSNSYIEMCYRVQTQLGNINVAGESSSNSTSSHPQNNHLSDLLLECTPGGNVTGTREASYGHHHHRLLLEYFEAGLEACEICEILLRSIHQASTNHCMIERVIKLAKRLRERDNEDCVTTKNLCGAIFMELASYSSLRNPLSTFSPNKFPNVDTRYSVLLKRLTSKCKRIRRRRKVIICLKKAGGYALVVSYPVLAIALVVLACHSMVGIIATPGLIFSSRGLLKMKTDKKKRRRSVRARKLERLGSQLDIAAKGIYSLIIDFETMSLLVGRLYDEIEFSKAVADMCLRNGTTAVLKEVVRELQIHESCFLEQLEELEDHIYLCLLNINRSRRLLEEITKE